MNDIPRISTLDLRQIRLLYLLLTQRSITRVADQIGVTQPAVSIALSRLRQVFGDPLLVRAGGVMVPTARGMALVTPVSTLLDAYERLAVDPEKFDPSLTLRRFSIASPNYLTALLLPSLTADMIAAAPNIRLSARTALSEEDPVTALADGRTDLLIRELEPGFGPPEKRGPVRRPAGVHPGRLASLRRAGSVDPAGIPVAGPQLAHRRRRRAVQPDR